MQRAIDIIQGITADAEVGKIYKGTVGRSSTSAPSWKSCPAPTACCTSRRSAPGRVNKVTDVLKEGDEIMVKVLEVDKQGKIRLSRKEAMQAEQTAQSQS